MTTTTLHPFTLSPDALKRQPQEGAPIRRTANHFASAQAPIAKTSVQPVQDVYFSGRRMSRAWGAGRDRYDDVPFSTKMKLLVVIPVAATAAVIGGMSIADVVTAVGAHFGSSPAIEAIDASHERLEDIPARNKDAIAKERQVMTSAVVDHLVSTARDADQSELADTVDRLRGMLGAEDQKTVADLIATIENHEPLNASDPDSTASLADNEAFGAMFKAVTAKHNIPPEQAAAAQEVMQGILDDRSLDSTTKWLLLAAVLIPLLMLGNSFLAAKASHPDTFWGFLGWNALHGVTATAKWLTLGLPGKLLPPVFHFFTDLPMSSGSYTLRERMKQQQRQGGQELDDDEDAPDPQTHYRPYGTQDVPDSEYGGGAEPGSTSRRSSGDDRTAFWGDVFAPERMQMINNMLPLTNYRELSGNIESRLREAPQGVFSHEVREDINEFVQDVPDQRRQLEDRVGGDDRQLDDLVWNNLKQPVQELINRNMLDDKAQRSLQALLDQYDYGRRHDEPELVALLLVNQWVYERLNPAGRLALSGKARKQADPRLHLIAAMEPLTHSTEIPNKIIYPRDPGLSRLVGQITNLGSQNYQGLADLFFSLCKPGSTPMRARLGATQADPNDRFANVPFTQRQEVLDLVQGYCKSAKSRKGEPPLGIRPPILGLLMLSQLLYYDERR